MQEIRGTHLIMDGYVRDAGRLEPAAIVDLFDVLVDELDMQYLQRPVAMRVQLQENKLDSEEDEGGWSVYAQITTSHIALHGWPLRKAFMLDIFSCKPFDTDGASSIVCNILDVDRYVKQVVDRKGPLL